ncbi:MULTISPECIES: GDSL-type esterase/lipase family protein [Vitreoscilla]|uniref:GDSL-type esterase/lipase family protein n=1 Tax=Vitreoscilla stercoraria TaxID=61 RepID=A0ABY4EBB6_VITST|nr:MULTISPECIES: GDSL-type esterase/lipase family protein [Vitreoscilla]AUZ05929.2 acylhydrolase family protein [Vitreoscilla sp. C1]UOO92699.1 GDSL-type esterase/lipase family protein [Vitreoscilla stercoraria]
MSYKYVLQAACIALIGLFVNACGASHEQALSQNSTVLILGDSLTQGVGASSKTMAYPSLLAQSSGWNVINGGVSGNTSAQALERLPDLLSEYQPELVIISIGGNDFLQQKPNTETRANISQSIQLSQQNGAKVLLVAVPYLSLAAAIGHPSDHDMYEQLAKEHQVYLLQDAWSDVLGDEDLRADTVHANDAGYAKFHTTLVKKLEQIGWLP